MSATGSSPLFHLRMLSESSSKLNGIFRLCSRSEMRSKSCLNQYATRTGLPFAASMRSSNASSFRSCIGNTRLSGKGKIEPPQFKIFFKRCVIFFSRLRIAASDTPSSAAISTIFLSSKNTRGHGILGVAAIDGGRLQNRSSERTVTPYETQLEYPISFSRGLLRLRKAR